MRIIAIDASAVGGGSVSASIEAAAREVECAGGTVHRVRLYSMPSGHGTEVGLAEGRGFEGTVAATVDGILDSDGILLGTPSTPTGPNAATRALLRRLAACFAGHCLERGYHGRPTRLSPGERVGLLTSAPYPAAWASASAATLGTYVRVKRCMSRGGLQLIGHVAVADIPGYPLLKARAMARASQLGRTLAGHLQEEYALLPAYLEQEATVSVADLLAPRHVRIA